jgi:MFS family permease
LPAAAEAAAGRQSLNVRLGRPPRQTHPAEMSEKKQGLIPADHLSGDAEQPGGGGASKAEWDGKRWSVSGAPKAKPARWQQEMIPVGVCYAGCMFVCGNVLIGIGDALVELAHTVKMPPEDTGGLFLMRGVGQILATLFCADIYSTYHGNGILAACCIVVAVLWVLGAMITNVWVLYLWFFGTGLMTATLDIGTQILTRRAYGAKAGPWLTANTFCFATAGLLAPLVDYATKSLLQQCTVYGAVAAALALLTFVVSEECYVFPTKMPTDADAPPEVKSLGEKVKTSLFSWLDPVYRNDAVLALMIFFVIGGQNMMSNYLETFILITGVTEVSVDSGLLSLFWGSMVISRLVAMFKLQPGLTTKPLIRQMYIMFLGCMIAAVPLWLAPNMMGQPDLTSACDSTSDSDQISLSPASLCFTAGVPVPVQCPMAKVGDLYFNCSAGHSELDKNKVSGFRVVPGRKGGQPCWRGDPDAKKGDADHTYTWMCGTKDIGGKTLSPHDEGNHPSWPLFGAFYLSQCRALCPQPVSRARASSTRQISPACVRCRRACLLSPETTWLLVVQWATSPTAFSSAPFSATSSTFTTV